MDESERSSEPGVAEETSSAPGVAAELSHAPRIPEGPRPARGSCSSACARGRGEQSCWSWPPRAHTSWAARSAICCCGRAPRELDVVLVDEDAEFGEAVAGLARALAARFGVPAGSSEHERFGTAIVAWDGGRIDVAAARRERYPQPGALPEVEPAGSPRTCGGATSRSTRSRWPSTMPARPRGCRGRRVHARVERRACSRVSCWRRGRAGGPARGPSAGAARAQLPRRSDAAAAPGALPRAAGLRGRAGHGRAGRGGRRGRGARDDLRRARRRRAAPGAVRAGSAGGVCGARRAWGCSARCTRGCASSRRWCASARAAWWRPA